MTRLKSRRTSNVSLVIHHFAETLRQALGAAQFDLVVATYGRIRHVADVMVNHTDRLITVGGSPGLRGSRQPDRLFPAGQQTPLPEDAPRVESEQEFKFGYLARISEDNVMEHGTSGHYQATHFRYPLIYGPRQLRPAEWSVIRRVLDGRSYLVLPDAGLTMITRGYSRNMAHAVLLAVDHPEVAAGQIYNCGDVHQLTMAQWAQVICTELNAELEVVSVPGPLAYPARDMMINRRTSNHQLFDLHKIRAELGYSDQVSAVTALQQTVRWYVDNPPDETDEMRALRAVHYKTEDEMVEIVRTADASLSLVEHADPEYRHPYAHPKKPGQGSDHHGR